jgi:hypothetical protein
VVLAAPADVPASAVLAELDPALELDLASVDLAQEDLLDCCLREAERLLQDVRLDARRSVAEAPVSATKRAKKAR